MWLKFDRGKWWGVDALRLLSLGCLCACRFEHKAVQLHGGAGYMLEYPVARALADSRVPRIYGGSNEIMKELIARTCQK
jgi:alkylation response protein AidB-like acyl-CoA dehydrogenase